MKRTGNTLLCVKIASRGDLLLAAPAFRALRAARPRAHLTLLVGASCEDVARRLPYFDEVAVIDDRALFSRARRTQAGAAWRMLRRMCRGVGGRPFAEVLVFHRDRRYALLARLAGIPVRRGLADGSRGSHLTHPYAPDSREHDSAQYLRMALPDAPVEEDALPLAGLWRFRPGEREAALERAATLGFRPGRGPWVALGFGGGRNVKNRTALKQWPLESYRRLAALLVARGYGVAWLGDGEDAAALGGEAPEGVVLAGALSVAESAAVLDACALAVCNDTLLLHLSEAVATPTVALFGPTDPAHYGPRGPRSATLWLGESLPCSPCSRSGVIPPCPFGHRCLRDLPVEAVLSRVEAGLAGLPAAGGARQPSGAR